MTAEEIRNAPTTKPDSAAIFLREIAAQLAEMNELQRLKPLGTLEEPIFLREAKT